MTSVVHPPYRDAGRAEDPPEPQAPQGEYAPAAPAPELLPAPRSGKSASAVELLAPAGGLDCGYAAFYYGADAIYLGLKKFSARAEAENFTLEELDAVTAFAHAQTPRRRVFVTVNTVIRQDEMHELIEALAALEAIGVDALIVQDLGVLHAVRKHFPKLELHASTQMAVHNRAGAEALARLGFTRVVLARELTLEEIEEITRAAPIETEVFVHGALCYAYSGLCLFSSQTLGRSGNRGQCAYSCRDDYTVTGAPATLRDGSPTKRDPRTGFPFSMKDLALPDHLDALRGAGVACFKIEGRKKNALYVASSTDYYRRLIDGTMDPNARPDYEADLQTVFSRPWTRLFLDSHKDKEVADRDTVGHRGTPIGKVERVERIAAGDERAWLCFTTARRIERFDGLQIDLPKLGRPFGFSVGELRIVEKARRREAFEAPEGARVEVALPENYPTLPQGAPIYCASSQAVKQRYRFETPKAGLFRARHALHVKGELTRASLKIRLGLAHPDANGGPRAEAELKGPFEPAKDPAKTEAAFLTAFEKLGNTRFTLSLAELVNLEGLFVPVSQLNNVRRELVADLDAQLDRAQFARVEASAKDYLDLPAKPPSIEAQWSAKVDRIGFVDAFEAEDWRGLDEIVVDIARDPLPNLQGRLDELGAALGRDKVRLALPAITRKWEEKGIRQKIEKLRAAGWRKWEGSNLAAWSYLAADPASEKQNLDLAADWALYTVNTAAAQQLLEMGCTRFALSPEDGVANMRALLRVFGEQAVVIVHQDTPLFVAESCAYANLIGGCPGKANCLFESMEMTSSHGEKVTALDYHCRTIVLNRGPFCLGTRIKELEGAGARRFRADFLYRPFAPLAVRQAWRTLRAGLNVPGGHAANFDRGIL
ncbi:MAG: U32 family peptidase [Planctomycetes bacterium]|nr:U32 family peptidase [Planctomycetota bacterium]